MMTPIDPTVTPVDPGLGRRWFWQQCLGLEAAYASEAGPAHRGRNEDSCIHMPSGAEPVFCAVADGVGGGALGDVASNALVQHCAKAGPEVYADAAKLAEWLKQSDQAVREAVARRTDRPGASTLAAAWFLPGRRAQVVNIGDCRVYRLSPKLLGGYAISQLTQDQTYANLGRKPPAGGSPDDPACMAGVGAVGNPKARSIALRERELLLLCSDGVHKFVEDAAIAEAVAAALAEGHGLRGACRALVEQAQANLSHDDCSALLVMRHGWPGAGWAYWLALLASVAGAALFALDGLRIV